MKHSFDRGRRAFLAGAAALGATSPLASFRPAWAKPAGLDAKAPPALSGERIELAVGHSRFRLGGRTGHAITVNDALPGPLIRLKEGQTVELAVTNRLEEATSIHWHGILLPFDMDGVPGISFPGIAPGETFRYAFKVRQAGTFWYHSHSGLQEPLGHYGPMVIDPAGADPVAYDREHVVVLSDWSFTHPHVLLRKLKQEAGYFNRQALTLGGLGRADDPEEAMSLDDRMMWDGMRMDPTDIADVTSETYTYLVNGHGPADRWTGLFRPGERVRLRIINASAMSIFQLRIPGLPMTVVNADGENVRPVEVDELQISVAETYDVVVTPPDDRAYGVVAESVDRSGMALGLLAPRLGMQAPEPPPARPRPLLGMADMGMMDHAAMGHDMAGMEHEMDMRDVSKPPPGMEVGVGVDMIAPDPRDRTGDPGLGLENAPHRVLTYRDLVSLTPNRDTRPPTRMIEIHLTGNMERFMWSFDGRKFSDGVEPVRLARDERVRVKLVNDTMMQHPIHLHGHFFELVTGNPGRHPLKHTVNVLPGGTASFDLTADNPGDWAFHCHLLFHMHAGMFKIFTVRPLGEAPA